LSDDYGKTLEKAFADAQAAMKKKASAKNIKAVAAAKKALDEHRAEQAATADPEARRFRTLLEVLYYLQGEGWKVSKSKLYEDQRKIEKEEDGTWTKQAVDEYARLRLTRLDGTTDEGRGAAERKEEIEAQIAQAKLEKLRRENEIEQGRWVRRSEVESMLAARASALMAGVGPEYIHREAAGIIELVGGDADRAPDLIDHWLKRVEELFDRYSRLMEFTVPGEEELDEA